MTHDELLATIEELRFNCGLDHSDPNTDALRAVVELHKPFSDGDCQECTRPFQVRYPCPTIQQIIENLK